jgi:hypothetical protein
MIVDSQSPAGEGVRLHSKADDAGWTFSAKRLRPTSDSLVSG